MKKFQIVIVLFFFSNYLFGQINQSADPGSTGMTWNVIDMAESSVTNEAILTINLGNFGSSGNIPQNSVEWTINLPRIVRFKQFNNLGSTPFTISSNSIDPEDGTTIIKLQNTNIAPCSFTNLTCSWNLELVAVAHEIGGPLKATFNVRRLLPAQVGNANQTNDNQESSIAVSVVLPVKLESFTALAKNCGSELKWEVSREENFSHYEIERSLDSDEFIKIGNVKSGKKQYSYLDEIVGAKTARYRLKLVDLDGTFTYSNVKTISINCNSKLIKVYPTPTNSKVTVSGLTLNDKVSLINSAGQILSTKVAANALLDLDLSRYAAGVYNVLVVDKNGKSSSYKVVKN